MLATFLQDGEIPRRGGEIVARGREAADLLIRDERTRAVARRGREARDWLTHDDRARAAARRGRDAREWLTHDERGRIVGLLLVSIAMSIAMTLLVSAVAGMMSRRRAGPAGSVEPSVDEVAAAAERLGDEAVGIPVMEDVAAEPEVAAPAEA